MFRNDRTPLHRSPACGVYRRNLWRLSSREIEENTLESLLKRTGAVPGENGVIRFA